MRAGPPGPSPWSIATVLLVVLVAFFGLLTELGPILGPAIGVGGVLLSARWRTRPNPSPSGLALVPAFAGLGILLLAAPVAVDTGLFGGLCALGLLLWLADDPHGEGGGGRRAASSLGLCALAFALAWAVALPGAGFGQDVGLAATLAILALVLVAVTLLRVVLLPRGQTA